MVGIIFPFVIFALHHFGAPYYIELIVAFGALLLHFDAESPLRSLMLVIGTLALAVPIFALKPENLARLYPFMVSLAALSAFIASARDGGEILITFAEKFSLYLGKLLGRRLGRRFREMAPEKRANLRAALPIWIAGIGVNTSILFVFLFCGSDTAWLTYAGFISYLVIFGLGAATVARVARAGRRSIHAS